MLNNEEFEETNGAARLFTTIVGAAIRAFLAVTTAGFAYMYGGDIWSWILPYPMANYMAAVTLVILVDGLAFGWTYLRRASADTLEQQNYSRMGAWLDMALSLIVTGVFIILTTPLLAASVSAEVLTVLLNLSSWLGIVVGVVAFAGNGLIWHFFDNASAASIKQMNMNERRAKNMTSAHRLDMRRLDMQNAKAIQRIEEALPQLTDRAASQSRDNYLAARFAQVDRNGDGVLDFDEIEQATFPQPQREIGYSRAERPQRLGAETHPAPVEITPQTYALATVDTPDDKVLAINIQDRVDAQRRGEHHARQNNVSVRVIEVDANGNQGDIVTYRPDKIQNARSTTPSGSNFPLR